MASSDDICSPAAPLSEGSLIPIRVHAPQSALDALKERISSTRWPDREVVSDWSQGAPLAAMKRLIEYWRFEYDWRRFENRLNRLPNFRVRLDGLGVHFLHIKSKHQNALPMIMTHGWPGSIGEFLDVVAPLTDPTAHGGSENDAFHLVIPSLPGYGFSERPSETGWTVDRVASAWNVLMNLLGYQRYVAQGGDWGSAVTRAIARNKPTSLAAIHLNMVICFPAKDDDVSDEESQDAIAAANEHKRWGIGYSTQQSTRPQTLGYALADSPVGQAAWIYEKFHAWTENDGLPESALSIDQILDTITLYWLTNTATSSARLYWESLRTSFGDEKIDTPTACTIFPGELRRPPKKWAERTFNNLIYWNRAARGGHFAAFEQPEIFTEELRNAFRSIR